MSPQEFSSEFDILYNNVMSNMASSIDEYEKSVLLTKAQEELIKNYFNPLGNKYGQGMDNSPKRQIDLSELVSTATSASGGGITPATGISSVDLRAVSYFLPNDILVILNETAKTSNTVGGDNIKVTQVVPIHYVEYTRLMSKPYKEPLKNQTWKLLQDSNTSMVSQLIPTSGTKVDLYSVRYIRKPKPIILTDLQAEFNGLTIDGQSQPILTNGHACELNPSIHREILDRAVELAKVAYMENTDAVVQINTRNE